MALDINVDDDEKCVSCSRELAKIFGLKYVLERTGSKNMMAVYLNQKHKTPVLTVEIGGSKEIFPDTKRLAIRGIKNFLVLNRMLDSETEMEIDQFYSDHRLILRTEVAGILDLDIELGDRVKSGEKIGEIRDPITQKNIDIITPIDGYIFSKRSSNQVSKGKSLLSIISDLDHHQFESDDLDLQNFNITHFK